MSRPIKKPRQERYASLVPQVCEILNVESSKDWRILHRDGDHVLVHFVDSQRTNMLQFGHLRGIIIDLQTRAIVRDTFSYEPECVCEEIPVAEDGSIKLESLNGDYSMLIFLAGCYSLQRGHEGVVIDIWKDKDGKVHISSLKHMNVDQAHSRWSNSLSYYQIYQQLGLPPPERHFDPKYKTSRFVHTYLIKHPEITTATKEPVGTGYAVYLGWKEMPRSPLAKKESDDEFEPHPVEISTITPHTTHKLIEAQQSASKEGQKLIYLPGNISVKTANVHLRYGFYVPWNDEEVDVVLGTGEFVILTDTNTGKIYRILSPAYHWRSLIRGRINHIPYNFFTLAHHATIRQKLPKGQIKREQKRGIAHQERPDYFKTGFFPHLNKEDNKNIRELVSKGGNVIRLIGDKPLDLKNYHDRLYNIWLCLLLAVPVHKQLEVLDCIENYEIYLMKGSEAAIMLSRQKESAAESKAEGERERTIAYARHLCYFKNEGYFPDKQRHSELRTYNVMKRLRLMRPQDSYRWIKRLIREVERPYVEHTKKNVEKENKGTTETEEY